MWQTHFVLCLFGCVAFAAVSQAVYEDCEQPPAVEHASFEIDETNDIYKAIYSCQSGFELKGSAELICDLDTDEWQGEPPTCAASGEQTERKRKLLTIPEEPNVSTEMASILDMSCIQAKVQAPEISHGAVKKYERRRKGDKLFLVAYYSCNENYDFEDAQVMALYCRAKQWVGEVPTCLPLGGEYTEEEEANEDEGEGEGEGVEYDEYETVPDDVEHGKKPAAEEEQPVAPPPPPPPAAAAEQTETAAQPVEAPIEAAPQPAEPAETETQPEPELESESAAEVQPPEEPTVAITPAEVTDISIVVPPTADPYTPRLLDELCGEDRGGCAHKCQRLLFPGENEPRLKCSCLAGYTLDPSDDASCLDIDECQESNGGCSQLCHNLLGSFECACEKGYQLDSLTGNSCVDINECLLRNGHGPCQDTCHNLLPGYNCSCAGLPGTQLAANGHDCVDAGQCAKQNGGCSHGCVSTVGRVFCLCPSGFVMSGDGKHCTDIDECAQPELAAQCSAGCENTQGSYRCVTPPPTINSTLSEAVEEEQNVEQNEVEEQPARVDCSAGFKLAAGGSECEDINECNIVVDDEHNEEYVPHRICQQQCENSLGSYRCYCDAGHHLLEDQHSCAPDNCQDLDNPQLNRTRCAHHCVNLPNGRYECVCPKGYRLGDDRHSCIVAENACTQEHGHERCRPGSCQASEQNDSFSCLCPAGYESAQASCQDIDECARGLHNCSHTCVNEEGGYQCQCPAGMQLEHEHSCVAHDPCAYNNNGCEQLCLTAEAGACGCNAGYRLSEDTKSCVDVDECQQNNGDCQQLCRNLPGAYECHCAPGFEFLSGELSGYCFDVDECSRGTHACGAASRCENLNGSYTCRCEQGYALGLDISNAAAAANQTAQSSASSALTIIAPQPCLDIDECSLANGNCSHFCLNLPGSFQCACAPGHTLSQLDNSSCLPDNPCLRDNGGCSHSCHYKGGLAYCACPLGYMLAPDAQRCLDVDECQLGHAQCAQLCLNTPGGFACACADGYRLASDGFACLDIDECAESFGNCSDICINLLGSHACACEAGYQLADDARSCQDVDECASESAGGCTHECYNRAGGYDCGCPLGYLLQEDARSCRPLPVSCPPGSRQTATGCAAIECGAGLLLGADGSCVDIDECRLNNGGCSHQCLNRVGSYECSCPLGLTLSGDKQCVASCGAGYQRSAQDASQCEDIDECAQAGVCQHKCENTPGSFRCVCPAGYSLAANARSCQPVRAVQPAVVRDLCPHFQAPANGQARCNKYRHKRERFIITRCRLSCNQGYQLQGPHIRACGASGVWEGEQNKCLPISQPRSFHSNLLPHAAACAALQPPRYGIITPPACTQQASRFGTACMLSCHAGYAPATPILNTCMGASGWSFGNALECQPFGLASFKAWSVNAQLPQLPQLSQLTQLPQLPQGQPPYIKCPRSTLIQLQPGQVKAHVLLQKPLTNVDYHHVQAQPAWAAKLQAHLPAGVHPVMYEARDPRTGQTASCRLQVTIRPAQAQQSANLVANVPAATSINGATYYCTPSFEVYLKENQNLRSVTWQEPQFEGKLLKLIKSHFPGALFGQGDHTVSYVATTVNGKVMRCSFQIRVNAALPTPAPAHAHFDFPALPSALPPVAAAAPAALTQRSEDTGGQLESFVICAGQQPVKVTARQSVNLPVGCTLKNVRKNAKSPPAFLKRGLLTSLWRPYGPF